jgi:hypothetical protein
MALGPSLEFAGALPALMRLFLLVLGPGVQAHDYSFM